MMKKDGIENNDIDKVKNYLLNLGFKCNSYPTAKHLIYSKEGEKVVIKNSKKTNL